LTVGDETRLPTWLFAREGITIRIRRLPDLRIDIESSEGSTRAFAFPDIDELTAFQCGFEQHLIDTGWSLVEFGPERRSGRERRTVPRPGRDRRRYTGFRTTES
jgi:hypothetical protein